MGTGEERDDDSKRPALPESPPGRLVDMTPRPTYIVFITATKHSREGSPCMQKVLEFEWMKNCMDENETT